MERHLTDVRRYDALADAGVVGRIVGHLGLSLYGRDAAHVAASDPDEIRTVCHSWCRGRLGAVDPKHIDRAVSLVRETMQRDRMKDRVTFYYLCAKHLGKLDAI